MVTPCAHTESLCFGCGSDGYLGAVTTHCQFTTATALAALPCPLWCPLAHEHGRGTHGHAPSHSSSPSTLLTRSAALILSRWEVGKHPRCPSTTAYARGTIAPCHWGMFSLAASCSSLPDPPGTAGSAGATGTSLTVRRSEEAAARPAPTEARGFLRLLSPAVPVPGLYEAEGRRTAGLAGRQGAL